MVVERIGELQRPGQGRVQDIHPGTVLQNVSGRQTYPGRHARAVNIIKFIRVCRPNAVDIPGQSEIALRDNGQAIFGQNIVLEFQVVLRGKPPPFTLFILIPKLDF